MAALTLILQITGFAIAFADSTIDNMAAKSQPGIWVVVAGLTVQMTALLAALCLIGIVYLNAAAAYRKYGYTTFHRDVGYVPLDRRFQVFLAVLPVACVCVLIRLVYRINSFAQGLRGEWSMDQGMFIGFEGFLVVYALSMLSVCHPSVFMRDGMRGGVDSETKFSKGERDLDEAGKPYVQHPKVANNIGRI